MIKLRTAIDKYSHSATGTIRDMQHDAAVAHALVKAMDAAASLGNLCERETIKELWKHAQDTLRTDFGIEESP